MPATWHDACRAGQLAVDGPAVATAKDNRERQSGGQANHGPVTGHGWVLLTT